MTPALERWRLVGILLLVGPFYAIGLRWGLPSDARRDLVLYPADRTPQLYERINAARNKLYEKLDSTLPGDVSADETNAEDSQLHSLSSFLVRTDDGDEKQILVVLSKIKIHPLNLDPGFYSYGGPYIAGVGATLLTAKWLGAIILKSDIAFYYQNPSLMGTIFIWGRIFSAAMGLLCAGLFYRLARRLLSFPASLTATLIFALAPINIYLGHTVKPHLLSTAFTLGGLGACLDILTSPSLRKYIKAGILLGLATGTTVYLWPFTLFLPVAHFSRPPIKENSSAAASFFDRPLWAGLAAAVLVFFVVNPFIAAHPARWLAEMRHISSVSCPPSFTWSGAQAVLGSDILYGFGVIPCGLLLFLGGTQWKSVKAAPRLLLGLCAMILSLWIVQFGQCSTGASPWPARFMASGFSLMALGIGGGLEKLSTRRRALAGALATLAILFTLEQAAFAVANYARDNPETSLGFEGGEWINTHIKEGSEIGVSLPLLTHWYPPFHFVGYSLRVIPAGDALDTTKSPEYFLLSANPTLSARTDSPPIPYDHFTDLYELKRAFLPENAAFYSEHFSGANFPFWIYRRKDSDHHFPPGLNPVS